LSGRQEEGAALLVCSFRSQLIFFLKHKKITKNKKHKKIKK